MDIRYTPKAIFFGSDDLQRRETSPPDCPEEYKWVRLFLLSYVHSGDTYNTYRREVERFVQWVWYVHKGHVATVDRHTCLIYIQFYQKPPQGWISTRNHKRFILMDGLACPNPEWRPFVVPIGREKKISPASIKSMLACLSTFYSFLVHEGVITVNPIQMIRQKKQLIQSTQTNRVKRRLSLLQWKYVIEVSEFHAINDLKYERHLFILSMFFLLGVRISEIASTEKGNKRMGLFYQDKHGLWWFEALGKGNKKRDVAVPDEMLDALKRFRLSMGISELPPPDDHVSLIPKRKGYGGIAQRQIREMVSVSFNQAIEQMMIDGRMNEAKTLESATVHWLRHTAISEDVTQRPSEHVRDDVGHDNIATTSLYMDVLDEVRHQSAKKKRLKPYDPDR